MFISKTLPLLPSPTPRKLYSHFYFDIFSVLSQNGQKKERKIFTFFSTLFSLIIITRATNNGCSIIVFLFPQFFMSIMMVMRYRLGNSSRRILCGNRECGLRSIYSCYDYHHYHYCIDKDIC